MSDVERLPLFPLASVVLFPRVRCPIHIFELRYRQLTARAIDSERRIGMVAVLPECVNDMSGDPPVYTIGCAGSIAEHKLLPDGRFQLVLIGTQRFRIQREIERGADRLYRIAEVEFLEDRLASSDRPQLQQLRPQVIALAHRFVSQIAPARATAFDAGHLTGVEDAVLASALCNALPFPAAEKQGLLECPGILERFQQLEALLRFQLAEQSLGAARDSGRLH